MKPPLASSSSPIMEIFRHFQGKFATVLLCFLSISTVFVLFINPSSSPFIVVTTHTLPLRQPTNSSTPAATNNSIQQVAGEVDNTNSNSNSSSSSSSNRSGAPGLSGCDLFAGRWVRDERGYSVYSNRTCRTMPEVKNCGKYGKDQAYLGYRWRPDGCELPVFDPPRFLRMVRGKRLMFIGDSLARNQMESLLCLLGQAETPVDTYSGAKEKHRTWYFPGHDFTLMVVWAEFLVESHEIIVNGTPSNTFSINLDNMNPVWAEKLPQLNYAIINGGNWFTRKTYIHQGGKIIGCVNCYKESIPKIVSATAVRLVFKAALNYIRECKECENLLAIMRTYSMSHFEHGSWYTGGYCNRTHPWDVSDLSPSQQAWEYRKMQLEEMEKVNAKGRRKFELMDVTMAMMMRPDAHPGRHWVGKTTSDCLHWCLPGPVDMWNEALLEIIRRNL